MPDWIPARLRNAAAARPYPPKCPAIAHSSTPPPTPATASVPSIRMILSAWRACRMTFMPILLAGGEVPSRGILAAGQFLTPQRPALSRKGSGVWRDYSHLSINMLSHLRKRGCHTRRIDPPGLGPGLCAPAFPRVSLCRAAIGGLNSSIIGRSVAVLTPKNTGDHAPFERLIRIESRNQVIGSQRTVSDLGLPGPHTGNPNKFDMPIRQ